MMKARAGKSLFVLVFIFFGGGGAGGAVFILGEEVPGDLKQGLKSEHPTARMSL